MHMSLCKGEFKYKSKRKNNNHLKTNFTWPLNAFSSVLQTFSLRFKIPCIKTEWQNSGLFQQCGLCIFHKSKLHQSNNEIQTSL